MSFLDQSTLIREKLAELLEREEEWTRAAQVLAGIDLDSGQRFGGRGSGGDACCIVVFCVIAMPSIAHCEQRLQEMESGC